MVPARSFMVWKNQPAQGADAGYDPLRRCILVGTFLAAPGWHRHSHDDWHGKALLLLLFPLLLLVNG